MRVRLQGALTALLLVGSGCASKVQRATILPQQEPPTSEETRAPAPEESPATARRYVVDRARSRFELFGSDVLTGEHRGTFRTWSAEVMLPSPSLGESRPTIDATVEMDSIELDLPGVAGVLKRSFLETHRYPQATLRGTLSRTNGPPTEYMVEGVAVIHGVSHGIRFTGTLGLESEGYRFRTTFVVSRKDFKIHYAPLEAFVRDDVRIVLNLLAIPVWDEPGKENPPPPAAREARRSAPSTAARR